MSNSATRHRILKFCIASIAKESTVSNPPSAQRCQTNQEQTIDWFEYIGEQIYHVSLVEYIIGSLQKRRRVRTLERSNALASDSWTFQRSSYSTQNSVWI